jgi:hypothetical protein
VSEEEQNLLRDQAMASVLSKLRIFEGQHESADVAAQETQLLELIGSNTGKS